ncbi:D-alanine--D-alanine ligase [secondary endosymbiont of Ctenarytaina eucalypti]|nr:D-alanine--D-alanine ligase [secondary endosymbiont of Ctenarytaina eucalypti]
MQQKERRKLRVAVLFGGQSAEHEVSLRSSINVIRAINRKKYDLTLIGVDKYGRWTLCREKDYLINPENPATICLSPAQSYLGVVPGQQHPQLINAANGQALPFIDVAFSVLHGTYGEDGSVQGLLRVLSIPYVGADVLGSAVCMDKDMTKRVLRDAGVPVTPSVTLFRQGGAIRNFDAIVSQLGLPIFIKPANQGSSVGVSRVNNRTAFDEAIALAFYYDAKILVEQAIIGREIETAVLGNDSPEVSVCGEICSNDAFYTYNIKYFKSDQPGLIIPAPLTASVDAAIRKTARQAYLALSCSIMARVDFFLTDQGEILLNEVNTLPGFTSLSMYPKLWAASGLDYCALVDRLLTLALSRAHEARLG